MRYIGVNIMIKLLLKSFHNQFSLLSVWRNINVCWYRFFLKRLKQVRKHEHYKLKYYQEHIIGATQQTHIICITFIQRRPNVFDVGPTLYKCYTNVLCLLGMYVSPMSINNAHLSLCKGSNCDWQGHPVSNGGWCSGCACYSFQLKGIYCH